MVFAGACSVCGCAGSVHRLPQISDGNLSLVQTEVQAAGGAPQRHARTDEEATEMLRSALQRIRPPASEMCRQMNVGVCTWQFRGSSDRSLNASARPDGLIVINRGLVDYAANQEEVEMVIAHEIGHQAANHLVTAQRNKAVGAAVGAILLGALGAVASRGSYNGAAITRSAMDTGANVGGAIGRIAYSKEQEREADYLAAVILYRADVDLDKARGILVTMARASGRRETGMLDTHPAGPERLAGWDQAVAEIRASKGQLPQRA
ncbi:M48 family metallopeptidase [soil metagenome]